MKNKKLLFNHLVLQYHKSIGRLKRLSERGLNVRRQTILSKRIEKIKQQILSIKHALAKATAVAGFVSAMAVLQPNEANAQNFLPPVTNPFSLNLSSDSLSVIKSADFADLDADGDLDGIVYDKILNKFYTIKNDGTEQVPNFSNPILIPLLDIPDTISYYLSFNISLVDLDSDGDFDLMTLSEYGDFFYYENVGTNTTPEFNDWQGNPFQLINIPLAHIASDASAYYNGYKNTFAFVDVDGDGDLDIYTKSRFVTYYYLVEYYKGFYVENIGSTTNPSFEAPLMTGNIFGDGDFSDLDSDGDYDYVTMVFQYFVDDFTGSYISYIENIGTVTTPSFLSYINPFGLGPTFSGKQTCASFKDFDNDNDLDLMFIEAPNKFSYFENKVCDTIINTSISIEDSVSFTALQSAAQYQWIQCGTNSFHDVEGASSQSFYPESSGNYRVAITTDDCLAFSECYEFFAVEDIMEQNFIPPVINPFSLNIASNDIENISSSDYADLDADGDIDIIVYDRIVNALYLIKNEGTIESPNYINPVLIPTSLTDDTLYSICLADLDSDGDFDLMAGAFSGNFIYFKNIGTDSSAEYASPVTGAFSLGNISMNDWYDKYDVPYYLTINSVELVDLDADGDLDMFVAAEFENYIGLICNIYLKNIGTSTTPYFLSPSSTYTAGIYGLADFADIDRDNDFDFIYFWYSSYYNSSFAKFYQNVGLYFEPVFTGVQNPFGLGPIFPENLFSPSLTDFDNDNDLDLMLLQTPNNFYYFENKICNPAISNLISFEDNTLLTAIQSSAQYQWFECDNNTSTLIEGATEQTFVPMESGNYMVNITTDECAVNSQCYEFLTCQDLIDTTIYLFDGSYLSSNYQNNASYQWLNCNNGYSPIEDEVASIFYPQVSGIYSLEITEGNCKDTTACYEFNICALFSSEIIINEINIEALQDNAIYQWLNCDNDSLPIEGETNQIISPTFAGNFALSVSNQNCNLTSDCIEFIPCESLSEEIIIIGYTATAAQDSAYYEWINCDNGNVVSSGESNQSFTPEVSGNYSVIIYLGNCSYESDCYSLDLCNNIITTGVNFYNNSLTALEASADSYQWINCNSNYDPYIDGETNQSFTPNFSGSFAVEITKDNCTYLSECIEFIISGINDYSTSNQFSLIPNPTEGKLNIIANKPLQNALVQIKSTTGQIVFEQKNISGANLVFDLSNHANGLYFLEVTENGFTTRLKIIKE